MSATDDELTGSPVALGRLFAGGMVARNAPTPRLDRAARIKRRKVIFGSFSRVIAHTPHRLAVLRGQEGDRIVVQEKPARRFTSAKKREAKRLAVMRATATAIPRSNRKPRKGPSAEQRDAIKRREAKRIKHEARWALDVEAPL